MYSLQFIVNYNNHSKVSMVFDISRSLTKNLIDSIKCANCILFMYAVIRILYSLHSQIHDNTVCGDLRLKFDYLNCD